jgi:threonine/homoserine/homoserine lactone efflux protein
VFDTTLKRGLKAGLRVAAASLVTDVPLIAVCMLALNAAPTTYWTSSG